MPRSLKIAGTEFDIYRMVISTLVTLLGFFLLQFYNDNRRLAHKVDNLENNIIEIQTELRLHGIDLPLKAPDKR